MIDVSKIRVGDEVTVRHIVKQVDEKDTGFPIYVDFKSWVGANDIATHTPAPREFKPGDRVKWSHREDFTFEFICRKSWQSVIWNDGHGFQPVQLHDLRHADESE